VTDRKALIYSGLIVHGQSLDGLGPLSCASVFTASTLSVVAGKQFDLVARRGAVLA
jgi:hypothetical protein